MPATSYTQMHTARMAMAYKRGDLPLDKIPQGAHKAVESMAAMHESQLQDFMHMRKQGHKTLLDKK